ncbi:MAG: hypothetical protein QXG65_02390 [Thermoplasmata archaeon]
MRQAIALLVVAGLVVVGPALATAVPGPSAITLPGLSPVRDTAIEATSPLASSTTFGNVTNLTITDTSVQGRATYGFVVQSSVSPSGPNRTEFSLDSVYALAVSVRICQPGCADPALVTNLTYRAFQQVDAWTNVTTAASVVATLSNGSRSTVAALGLLTSHVQTMGGSFQSTASNVAGALTVPTNASSSYRSDSSVTFSPFLGLVPENPQAIRSWTSTASYQSAASWTANWTIGAGTGANSGSESTSNGTITLSGTALGIHPIGRATAYRLRLSFGPAPPLTLVAGIGVQVTLPNPFQGDLGPGWEMHNRVEGSIRASELWTDPSHPGQIVSGSVDFGAGVVDPTHPSSNTSLPNSSMPGQPMPSPEYSTYASCLQNSPASCPAVVSPGAPGSPASGPWADLALWAGGAAVVVVAAIGLVVGQRRKAPPVRYPQADLYPPGETWGPPADAPSGGNARGGAGTGSDDPLNGLW